MKFKFSYDIYVPSWIRISSFLIVSFFIASLVILIVTPWQQTSQGKGNVIAYDPNDRVQNINSTVPGRINKWYVTDGSAVKKGDIIAEVVDNDPLFIDRLKIERDSILKKYEAAKIASETAYLNLKRQEDLLKQGLSSRMKFEKAKIDYKKLLSDEASAAASLAKAEVKLSRQQTQLITAPQDGTILRVLHGSGSVIVKEGDVLAVFVPDTFTPAVQLYVNGNDLPLITPGREVRLQFEGWPAVQFSGWPSMAIGTFGGVVSIVDPSVSKIGKFRVIITPKKGESWPSNSYLRQGTRAYGWVLLNTVSLGYELWRQFNGFPASIDFPGQENQITTPLQRKESKKKKDKDND